MPTVRSTLLVRCASAGLAGFLPALAMAHHSYAMFDMSRTTTINGTVAKLEWINPHVFVWVYVAKPGGVPGFDLYAFENGPISTLTHSGWTKTSLKAGDRVSVLFFPLRDGRTGGYFIKALRPDGSELPGDSHAPGVARELARKTPVEEPAP